MEKALAIPDNDPGDALHSRIVQVVVDSIQLGCLVRYPVLLKWRLTYKIASDAELLIQCIHALVNLHVLPHSII
jgi:hypothetical protein